MRGQSMFLVVEHFSSAIAADKNIKISKVDFPVEMEQNSEV